MKRVFLVINSSRIKIPASRVALIRTDWQHTVENSQTSMSFHFLITIGDSKFSRTSPRMLNRSNPTLINYMRHHNRRTARQYSAEFGKTWTKEIIPRTEQDVQLYGWLHNYPYHNLNDLAWWANRRRPRHTLANYALASNACSRFAEILRQHETTAIHELSIGGRTTLLLPTNDAFEELTETPFSDSRSGRQFLFNHIVRGELTVRDIAQRCRQSKSGTTTFKTIGGKSVTARIDGSLISGNRKIFLTTADSPIQTSEIINHGIKCSNGVVFVLNGLLV
jgi:uncharacterized surface protein with fasciclin (FAS1) repeats